VGKRRPWSQGTGDWGKGGPDNKKERNIAGDEKNSHGGRDQQQNRRRKRMRTQGNAGLKNNLANPARRTRKGCTLEKRSRLGYSKGTAFGEKREKILYKREEAGGKKVGSEEGSEVVIQKRNRSYQRQATNLGGKSGKKGN